jgi:HAE1 family hydrophobic/amphiphilic exporter-1
MSSTSGRRSCWHSSQKLPQLRDVASDQQTNGTMLSLAIDRDQAARFGIQPSLIDQTLDDAFGQRQVTQYFTQLNSYHVILELTPALQTDPQTLSKIYVKSLTTGQMVPLSSFVKYDTRHVTFSVDQSPGTVPGGHAVVQSCPRCRAW